MYQAFMYSCAIVVSSDVAGRVLPKRDLVPSPPPPLAAGVESAAVVSP